MELKKDIFDYATKKIQFQALEKGVLKSIEHIVRQELPNLNSKLPNGYSIGAFNVVPPNDYAITPIVYLTSVQNNGKFANLAELPKLNKILMDEYHRLRETYGFRIELLHYNGIV